MTGKLRRLRNGALHRPQTALVTPAEVEPIKPAEPQVTMVPSADRISASSRHSAHCTPPFVETPNAFDAPLDAHIDCDAAALVVQCRTSDESRITQSTLCSLNMQLEEEAPPSPGLSPGLQSQATSEPAAAAGRDHQPPAGEALAVATDSLAVAQHSDASALVPEVPSLPVDANAYCADDWSARTYDPFDEMDRRAPAPLPPRFPVPQGPLMPGPQPPMLNGCPSMQACEPRTINPPPGNFSNYQVYAPMMLVPPPATFSMPPVPKQPGLCSPTQAGFEQGGATGSRYSPLLPANKLGSGSFGTVYRCRDKERNAEVAIKVCSRLFAESSKEGLNLMDTEWVRRELVILSQLRHRNVVRLLDAYTDADIAGNSSWRTLHMVMEKGDMDLAAYQQTCAFVREVDVHLIWYDLANGLDYVHSRGILHRDVKPKNCLVNLRHVVPHEAKLADFGLGRAVARPAFRDVNGILVRKATSCTKHTGTRYYRSPEVILQQPYNTKNDVWALGCTVYELSCRLTGRNTQVLFRGKSCYGLSNRSKGMRGNDDETDQLHMIFKYAGRPGRAEASRLTNSEELLAYIAKFPAYEPSDAPIKRAEFKRDVLKGMLRLVSEDRISAERVKKQLGVPAQRAKQAAEAVGEARPPAIEGTETRRPLKQEQLREAIASLVAELGRRRAQEGSCA